MAIRNTRILVNFKTKKVTHTRSHKGTEEYKELIEQGYEHVGDFKARTGLFFWIHEYFKPPIKSPDNELR